MESRGGTEELPLALLEGFNTLGYPVRSLFFCSCLCHCQGQSVSEAPLWVWNAPSTFAPSVPFLSLAISSRDQVA